MDRVRQNDAQQTAESNNCFFKLAYRLLRNVCIKVLGTNVVEVTLQKQLLPISIKIINVVDAVNTK